ncbi:MAG: response regulator transcription factor [Planctomycetota bacterium]|jgi:CheY-like chemotaxis protein
MTDEGGINDKGLEMLKKKAKKDTPAEEEKPAAEAVAPAEEQGKAEEPSEEKDADKKVEATADGIGSGAQATSDAPARVLVVEDSPPLRRMLEKILTSDGFAVDTAENGQIAIDLLTENAGQYSMMMLDIMMPVLDGIKTMATIKKDGIEGVPPVVICSCRSDKETVILANKLGVSGYILKPFKTDTVINKVREIVLSGESQ